VEIATNVHRIRSRIHRLPLVRILLQHSRPACVLSKRLLQCVSNISQFISGLSAASRCIYVVNAKNLEFRQYSNTFCTLHNFNVDCWYANCFLSTRDVLSMVWSSWTTLNPCDSVQDVRLITLIKSGIYTRKRLVHTLKFNTWNQKVVLLCLGQQLADCSDQWAWIEHRKHRWSRCYSVRKAEKGVPVLLQAV
jgi:hypothetical protein